ncbi:tyrosine-protein phosphatase [Curvibacter sp. RS43]|uniref:tyrosine-protein phosphatase n=1 Tax=Curvibacter microcysteis TaxID=3026419 RepID=UPI0023609A24|nr:tyrosine-protein phosphatase [Curvibacter sp. RS43]MDD0810550.1 tyrosine-protein phosphatase [Curvibacter sp. RS43]
MNLHNPSIPLAGASNFRDLGGYQGKDGRRLRLRRLFRSDHLAQLSAADIEQLQALQVGRTVDFRGEHERLAQAYTLPEVTQHALSIEPTVVQRAKDMQARGQTLTPEGAAALMEQTYRDFVLNNSPRFAQLFALLLEDDQPLVFHCTAGKDRTGLAAALILRALGVAPDVVMHDYLLTNQLYQRPALPHSEAPEAVLRVIWQVQPSFLEAALQTIDETHGGLAPYLHQALGLGPAELRRLESLYLA